MIVTDEGGLISDADFGDQQRSDVGEQMRRLLRIVALRSAEEMQDSYEFLSA